MGVYGGNGGRGGDHGDLNCGASPGSGGGGGNSGSEQSGSGASGGSGGNWWGGNGGSGGNGSPGAGGGVLIKGVSVAISGSINTYAGGGYSGYGGTLKIFYSSSYTPGSYYTGRTYIGTYDGNPPTMSVSPVSGTYLATLNYTASWYDSVSKLNTCSIRIDGVWYAVSGCSGTTKNYNGSFSAPGTHTVQLYGVDNDGNSAYSSVYTYVVQVSTPTVDVKADGSNGPINIDYNTSSTLSWTSTNANSCNASGSWSGTKGLSGSESTGNLTSDKTYTLSCTGDSGNASDSVIINIRAPKQCEDGVDSDGDGWVDYPADPGCSSATDNNESNSGGVQCSDGVDNDSDSFIDGNDSNCVHSSDDSEFVDPDFSLSKSSDINVIIIGDRQSNSGNATTTVNPNETFASDVSLSVDSITPSISGVSYVFSDGLLSSGEYGYGSLFTITVPSSATAGNYTVSVKGESLGLSKIVDIILNVSFIDPGFENF